MHFSRPRSHDSVVHTPAQKAEVEARLRDISASLSKRPMTASSSGATSIQIPLTTVSLNSNFDAYIIVNIGATNVPLVLDSGNSVLILPRFEDIESVPNWQQSYQVLGETTEPWGCPANVVKGPINIPTTTDGSYSINDCIFYACTDNAPNGERTANFGAACLSPWTASGWNVLPALGLTLQAPLSYITEYPFIEFEYAAATDIHGTTPVPKVDMGSILKLSPTLPQGYALFDILPNLMWMALTPKSLSIGGTKTSWPGIVNPSPIALIDTGGGPAFLSDPNDCVCNTPWPDSVTNPPWTSSSTGCQSISYDIGIELGDDKSSFAYEISGFILPPSAQGLTLVMCQINNYMMGQNGLNIGGISALVNSILVDYQGKRVGLKPKS
jgi:hypothetical protein